MTDIVERLREFEYSDEIGNGDFSLCDEAADTIESLRARVAELDEASELLHGLSEP